MTSSAISWHWFRESAASQVGLTYGMVYAALALALRHRVQVDRLLFPLLVLAAVTAAAERLGWLRHRQFLICLQAVAWGTAAATAALSQVLRPGRRRVRHRSPGRSGSSVFVAE
jgi:hypothetical protein